jgi:DNA anti-recombination protein RmuC
MERVSYAGGEPNTSARDSLRKMIAETQELLSQQIKAIHEAFDGAVRTYREIDELLPEKKHG